MQFEHLTERHHKSEWERVLWKKQNFPDNYVGKSFFRARTKCDKITYNQAFYGSLLVSLEICSSFSLVSLFYGVAEAQITSSSVIVFTGFLSSFGYVLIRTRQYCLSYERTRLFDTCVDDIKAIIFAVVLGWFFSPIIKTLTASVATDTIQACTVALLLLHLVLYPYGADVAIVNETMSHNLGLFAAVCLASRLHSDLDVFALVMLAVFLFNLLPTFKTFCEESFGRTYLFVLFLSVFPATLCGVFCFTPVLMPILLLIIVFTSVVAPTLFMQLQPHRKNIYGPWDEATIK